MIALLVDHLWQSTLFALGAGLLTLLLGRSGAGVRYWLWFAASMKFLVPFALLAAAGSALAVRLHLTLASPPEAVTVASAAFPATWAPPDAMEALGVATGPVPAAAAHLLDVRFDPTPVLVGAWALGLILIIPVWGFRWAQIRAALRQAAPIDLSAHITVRTSPTRLEPGVIGLWRPVLVLPEGIGDRLSAAELDAIVAHELSHVRRWDNLTAAMHMLVQAVFWFHPLVWWLGGRLIAERERACDEAVVRAGHDRETYARGIIAICRLYLAAPLACVAGASGSDLERRVKEILDRPLSAPLSLAAKASIALAGALAVASPVAASILAVPAKDALVAVRAPTVPIPLAAEGILAGVVPRSAAPPGSIALAVAQAPAAAEPSPEEIARRLADQQRPRAMVPFDAAHFDRYVGYYRLTPNQVFKLSRDGDKLFSQLTGQGPIQVYPESETKFFATVAAVQVSMALDAKGVATGIVLHQNGREMPAPRITEAEAKQIETAFARSKPSPPARDATFDPTHFDRYVGDYQLGPSQVFHFSRDGRAFLSRMTGQPTVEIYPVSETTFFAPLADARISFTIGSRGGATGLVLSQNGGQVSAPRISAAKAKAIEAALVKRIVDGSPAPGTAEFLRHYVESVEAAAPDYSGMAPALAEFSRSVRDRSAVLIKVWGPLQSIRFDGVTTAGFDRYTVFFKNAQIPVYVGPPDANGKVAVFGFSPTNPNPSPG